MKTVNRSVLVLRYREPFLRWVLAVSPEDPEDDSLREVTSVYLVPSDPEEEEESAPLDGIIPTIFESELELWCADRALWPSNRDRATFEAWFDVIVESIVYDLGEGPIRRKEF
jgi:hypothetical protein